MDVQLLAGAIAHAAKQLDASVTEGRGGLAFIETLAGPATARVIVDTARALAQTHAEVSAARANGTLREEWVAEKLAALSSDGRTLAQGLPALGVTAGDSLHTVARAFIGRTGEGLAETLAEVGTAAAQSLEPVALVTRFLERPLGEVAEEDILLTSTVSAATYRALVGEGAQGHVAADVLTSACSVALQGARTAAQVGLGRITSGEALAFVEDHTAAVVGTLAGRAVEYGLEKGGSVLGAWLGSYIGMQAQGAAVGQAVGRMVGTTLRPAVEAGARALVRPFIKMVKSAAASVMAWLRA